MDGRRMQEVLIRPRSCFLHYVRVVEGGVVTAIDQAALHTTTTTTATTTSVDGSLSNEPFGTTTTPPFTIPIPQEIQWSFATKRKNISFGLFRQSQSMSTGQRSGLGQDDRSSTTTSVAVSSITPASHSSSAPHLLPSSQSSSVQSSTSDISSIMLHHQSPPPPSGTSAITLPSRVSGIRHTGSLNVPPSQSLLPSTLPHPHSLSERKSSAPNLQSSSPPIASIPPLHPNVAKRSMTSLPYHPPSISVQNSTPSKPTSASNSHQQQSDVQYQVNPANAEIVPPELIQLLPISHFESSRRTIHGSFTVTEPGTYVLFFDNSYSVNTSKKLYFDCIVTNKNDPSSNDPFSSAASSAATPSKLPSSAQGWLLKKGNRSMQGYNKRWVHVSPEGILSYFKEAEGQCHGSVALRKAAVRLNHDALSIDVDSGIDLFHFKAMGTEDFHYWRRVFENHSTKTHADASTHHSPSSPSFKHMNSEPHTKAGRNEGIQELKEGFPPIIERLTQDLKRIQDLVESGQGRLESKLLWRDFTQVLQSIGDSLQTTLSLACTTQRRCHRILHTINHESHSSSIECSRSDFQTIKKLEVALSASLDDQNEIRAKFGLGNLKSMTDYLNDTSPTMSSPTTMYTPRTLRAGSFTSSFHNVEFYDAQQATSSTTPSEASEEDIVLPMDKAENPEFLEDDTDSLEDNIAPISPIKVDSPGRPDLPVIERRTCLPAPAISMDHVNFFSILRDNLGKDLSTVAMPIVLNEPLNLLQRLCEELEYSELLDTLPTLSDPIDRLCVVAAFAISGYSSTVYRPSRKPFNPLLGETYECDRPDKGFRFVGEKVSHHPPVMACHAESAHYIFAQDSLVKSKFWGKSMELSPTGMVHLDVKAQPSTAGEDDVKKDVSPLLDQYTWNKVTTCMRNIFSTSRTLDHYGQMEITSTKTGHRCVVQFKESGYFSAANNLVTGQVYLPDRTKSPIQLSGKWDEYVHKFHENTPNSVQVVWRKRPHPANHAQYYGFTQFAMELNELSVDLKPWLPKTDTRFRPDQRLYESGHLPESEREKLRLEQKQRETRKRMEAAGETWTPRWFELVPTPSTAPGLKKGGGVEGEKQRWVYHGGYWESRGRFEKLPDLW